jgi:hypothetical protein
MRQLPPRRPALQHEGPAPHKMYDSRPSRTPPKAVPFELHNLGGSRNLIPGLAEREMRPENPIAFQALGTPLNNNAPSPPTAIEINDLEIRVSSAQA